LFKSAFKGKKVLVTGHTGFKGSWLSLWLTSLGARVIGFSKYLPSEPSNYVVSRIGERIFRHVEGDVRDLRALGKAFTKERPDMVFHLAGQPIVRQSYVDPKLTFDTNLGGTVNVLECIRTTPGVKAAVIITSDKCYRNLEWVWGYRENDALGGDDPYSASKACAELACRAYVQSFFKEKKSAKIATTRAGNVIGGGDWAPDRIVPDCVRAWAEGAVPVIRNPQATRPWQHVLEPLSGYLWLGAELLSTGRLHGEAFNFGPDQKVNQPVGELIDKLFSYMEVGKREGWKHKPEAGMKEATLLKLSCDKALHLIGWHPVLAFDDTVRLTAEWYKAYYGGHRDMFGYSLAQIEYYSSEASRQRLSWVRGK
jgi:CDP-glucose 4,6-dehydratase